jgi:hypothetical protein
MILPIPLNLLVGGIRWVYYAMLRGISPGSYEELVMENKVIRSLLSEARSDRNFDVEDALEERDVLAQELQERTWQLHEAEKRIKECERMLVEAPITPIVRDDPPDKSGVDQP